MYDGFWEVACGCGGVFVVKVVNEWRSCGARTRSEEEHGQVGDNVKVTQKS